MSGHAGGRAGCTPGATRGPGQAGPRRAKPVHAGPRLDTPGHAWTRRAAAPGVGVHADRRAARNSWSWEDYAAPQGRGSAKHREGPALSSPAPEAAGRPRAGGRQWSSPGPEPAAGNGAARTPSRRPASGGMARDQRSTIELPPGWRSAARSWSARRPGIGKSAASAGACPRTSRRLFRVSASSRISVSMPPSRSFRASRRSRACRSRGRVSASMATSRRSTVATASHARRSPGPGNGTSVRQPTDPQPGRSAARGPVQRRHTGSPAPRGRANERVRARCGSPAPTTGRRTGRCRPASARAGSAPRGDPRRPIGPGAGSAPWLDQPNRGDFPCGDDGVGPLSAT